MLLRRPLLSYALIFLAVRLRNSFVHAQITSTEVGRTVVRTTPSIRTNPSVYAWSAWGAWSKCSKTCGGGISVQERFCLPRDSGRARKSRKRRKLLRSTDLSRRARNVASVPDCPGLGRRYHECNTMPCPGPQRDPLSEQCAIYDRRPFRGRFYTWVPYVDGNAPCTLNCRPRGQQFYASLALVTDGTPCTKPGYRAICVQGDCKIVGKESVLALASTASLRCGRQLVTGLFSRPHMPLGYSYVTTVPRGACRLNVSELTSTDNYIALKLTNGSYIFNGEFAVSSPGNYDAAGSRFQYSRVAGLDSVFSRGPLHHAIDIMILYTQPNPNIKYEYLSDFVPDTVPNTDTNVIPKLPPKSHPEQRHHRHHNDEPPRDFNNATLFAANKNSLNGFESQSQVSNVIDDRRFVWKIIAFTPCTRTCGGGLQIGKFKCVEDDWRNKEVSPNHCLGAPPASRRHRCATVPCPPRWRSTAWGPCPVCGPAHRSRIVGCVQDHARGITKISDQRCPLPVPSDKEACDIPNCDGTAVTESAPKMDSRRQIRQRDGIESFRSGPAISLASNTSDSFSKPVNQPSYSHSVAGGWLFTEWSECVGWCNSGGGVQTRAVRCSDPAGCGSHPAPISSQSCSLRGQCEAQWFTTEWSACSARCDGRQARGVICVGPTGRRLRDNSCKGPKPEATQACGNTCEPEWYLSDWGECQGPCEAGVRTRAVWCRGAGAAGAGGALQDSECPGRRPLAKKTCVPARCSTRPVVKPALQTNIEQQPPRVTRHHERNGGGGGPKTPCVDKLNNCELAVQARLCHYPYYGNYCCASCHG